LNGQALVATDTVEIGTYLNGTFTSIHSGVSTNADVNNDQTNDIGFFAHANVAKQDTSAIVGRQLAIKWNHAATGTWAIMYVDITTVGLDADIRDQWTAKSGNGSGSDNNTNDVSVSDLTTGGPNFNTLRTGAKFVNARFTGTNILGAPYFEIIPEPATYAALLGLFALVGVVLYRRR
ncbi:MAG: PEP-CTERM sorting domain-containing protein, partial [Opitutales bacterium]